MRGRRYTCGTCFRRLGTVVARGPAGGLKLVAIDRSKAVVCIDVDGGAVTVWCSRGHGTVLPAWAELAEIVPAEPVAA